MSETIAPEMQSFDPATMPLEGIRLIEASAGTGKTFSLAGLYLRLIVERRLDVQDILVMTFTRAATQELRERLRANLAKAARVAGEVPNDQREDAAERFAESVIAAADEDRAALARRLREAATRADQATITTIHGFAQRAAAENAFESALPFDRGEQIDDREVQREAASDYWRGRAFAADARQAKAFLALWGSPEDLFSELRDVLAKAHARLIQPEFAQVERERQQALQQWPKERDAFIACLAEVLEHGGLRANGPLKASLEAYGPEGLAERIDIGLAGTPDGFPALPAILADLGTDEGVKGHVKNAACKWCRPQDLVAITLLAGLQINGRLAAAAHAVQHIHELATRRKRERREYSFDDMIAALHAAVTDPERGPALAQALRRTWPWALVDEFQDTDPLQYAILRRIYGDTGAGDPGFRSAPSGLHDGPDVARMEPTAESGEPNGTSTELTDSRATADDGRSDPPSGDSEQAASIRETPTDTDAAPAENPLSPSGGEGESNAPGGLMLIGDPKQAIYAFRGGDVFAYLDAAKDAHGRYGMEINHRSTPAVVGGLDALFSAGGAQSFVLEAIQFLHVEAARAAGDRRLQTSDGELPGVTAWSIPADAGTNKGALQSRIQHATVDRIAALLEDGRLVPRDGETQPLEPRDVAVLVNTNREAAQMQQALVASGVPAVCVHQESVFASEAAGDLLWLLQTAATPLDSARLRRALTTPLFGLRLGDLVALDADEAQWSGWTERLQAAHVDWGRIGVQAMLEPFLQAAAERVLARTDGERRITDYLHVAERLQEAEHEVFGREGLVRWLETAIERASEGEVTEADRIRLEDDSELVQVTTVHRAKGLQWPVVFVPFAPWLGTGGFKKPDDLPLVFHDDDSRTVIDLGSSDTAVHRPNAVREHKAEQMRSLYVAFTRAEEALFFVHGAAKNALDGPLAWVLHHGDGIGADEWHGGKNPPDWFDAGRAHERLMQLQKTSDGALAVETLPAVDMPRQWVRPATGALEPARSDFPAPAEPWTVFSYSRLAGRMHDGGEEVAGSRDEVDAPSMPEADTLRDENAPAVIDWPRGAGFGQAFHNILEAVDFSAWPSPGQALGDGDRQRVTESLRLHGIAPEAEGGRAPVEDTASLVSHTLHAPLPEIGPLAAIPAERRRSELEFFLRLGGSSVESLLDRIAAAGYGGARLSGALPALRGLMQGFIDLVVEHDGRYWILDYKTNLLGPTRAEYAPSRLREAIAAHHYDLQYLIYSVALHRYLRQVLPGYDPATHWGGVLYLFVRGLDAAGEHGVFADRPDPELLDALDALLDGEVPA